MVSITKSLFKLAKSTREYINFSELKGNLFKHGLIWRKNCNHTKRGEGSGDPGGNSSSIEELWRQPLCQSVKGLAYKWCNNIIARPQPKPKHSQCLVSKLTLIQASSEPEFSQKDFILKCNHSALPPSPDSNRERGKRVPERAMREIGRVSILLFHSTSL